MTTSTTPSAPKITTAKQQLTRHVHTLEALLDEANEYSPTWVFPTESPDLKIFITTQRITLTNLKRRIEQQSDKLSALYEALVQASSNSDDTTFQPQLDAHWEDKRGDTLLNLAGKITQQLDKRLTELDCQEATLTLIKNNYNTTPAVTAQRESEPQATLVHPMNSLTIEQRLLSSELKVPEFHGDPTEFRAFWELFEELVHKQPYSNIAKLSILLSCCKGDAARSLRMIPRTGDSYERAIQQLKNQYEDPKRITMQMIHQLKSLKQCPDNPRALRNNLSDIQAIIATMQRQGEVVDSTYMTTMVTETFPKNIQEEIARKEFDSGREWTMENLIANLTLIIRRREHIESRNDHLHDHSVFHTRIRNTRPIQCIGCSRKHKFENCDTYRTTSQKITRLKTITACWKCFSPRHRTAACCRPDCMHCGGHHNSVICLRQPNPSPSYQKAWNPRSHSPTQSARRHRSPYTGPRPAITTFLPPRRASNIPHSQPTRPPRQTFNDQLPPVRPVTTPLGYKALDTSRLNQDRSPRRENAAPQRGTPSSNKRRVAFASPPFNDPETNVNFQTNSPSHQGNVTFSNHNNSTTRVRLMIVPLTVKNAYNNKEEHVYALLDSASDQSFISSSLADRLQLEPQLESTITVNTFGGHTEQKRVKRVEVLLLNHQGQPLRVCLLTNDTITHALPLMELQHHDKSFLHAQFPHIHDTWLNHPTIDVVPDILLGIDYFHYLLCPDEPVIQLPSGFFVTSTFFGPVISGSSYSTTVRPQPPQLYNDVISSHTTQCAAEQQNYDYSDLWKLPGVGIEDLQSDEELHKQIIANFYDTVQINNGKIYIQFPWKPNKHCLADNYNLALSRLHQLHTMRLKNPQCWSEYCTIIQEQIDKGFVEDAAHPPSSLNPLYYIPHQAVVKTTSVTTKTRIVLDASSKMRGQLSLNDVIHQGPLILPNLCGILLRSRFGRKIMIADVEKAFHMIYLQESERDSVRFLWLKDTTASPTPDNLRILRFCRLPFGINASPFLLGISIQYGIEQQAKHGGITQRLVDNLYVDNVLMLDDSTQSLLHTYRICKQIFANMSMNLRQFLTNDDLCNHYLDDNDKSTASVVKILGIPWNHTTDTFTITCKLTYAAHPTKRKILQATHSTFDPLGLLVPLLLPAKILLQDLWKDRHSWDEPLPEIHDSTWKTICDQADGFAASFPRPITNTHENMRYELHSFVDASTRAYAVVVYLRSLDSHNKISSSILMARQRLAPLNIKTMTIPRLELLALLIGVRLTNFLLKELKLKITRIRIYSDSQVALHWIQSTTKNGTFIDNRCKQIRDTIRSWSAHVNPSHLHYIPSDHNPADLATKGLNREQMQQRQWWSGPTFLQTHADQWPELPEIKWDISEDNSSSEVAQHSTLLTTSTTTPPPYKITALAKFSSITTLCNVMAIILKFLKHILYNKLSDETRARLTSQIPEIADVTSARPFCKLQAIDVQMAERALIKLMQSNITPAHHTKFDHLQLYKDNNGILRCRGRIQTKHLPQATLEPILLLPKHPLTHLLIHNAHIRCGHQGVNGTLVNLRLLYWIPKGRQVVRQCLRHCTTCKRWNGKPYFYPTSPPLPTARTQPTRPFSHIGVDLAGPFITTDTDRNNHKRWVFLSTCMTTRAVHLETVLDLSALQLLHVIRRFISRRGKPQLIISDNASNFTLGNELLSATDSDTDTHTSSFWSFLATEKIQWKFITPLSPWKGGFYERLIGVMKNTFKRIITRKSIDDATFTTIITECEAMINSRPLAYAGSTIDDSLIIRPIDFIMPQANVTPFTTASIENDNNDIDYIPRISTREQARNYFRAQLRHLQYLWNIWTTSYLLELRNFHQRRIKQKCFTRRQPLVGEVVLVMDENLHRHNWPLGLITHLNHDTDGAIRSVKLRTSKAVIERSINMLIPLELNGVMTERSPEHQQETTHTESTPETTNNTHNTNPSDSPTDSEHNVTRTRPILPRKAKTNKSYTYTTNTDTNKPPLLSTPPIHKQLLWKHWLTISLTLALFQLAHTQPTQKINLQCITGGVHMQLSQPSQQIQVCGNDYCIEMHEPDQNMNIQFPPEVTLHTYHITLKSIIDNTTRAFHWACPPSPFCEQITCNFCSQMVSNPECWPRIAIAVTGILFYIIAITLYISFALIKKTARTFNCLCRNIPSLLSLCNVTRQKRRTRHDSNDYTPFIELDNVNTKWNTTTLIKLITIVTSITPLVLSCQQTVLLPATLSQCDTSKHNCSNQTTLLAQLNQLQPEMCIQVQQGDQRIHFMRISLNALILRCRKETLYFTQNTITRIQYRKRCPHMGTCTGLKCAKINYDTLVDELDEANNYTGITYCSESCGGLGCSCGYPSSGCPFYRIYHIPLDDNVYEVFQCPSWFQTISINVQTQGTSHISQNIELKPYTKKRIANTTFEITSISSTPLSILHQRFISNNQTTAYVHTETEFSYACNTNPNKPHNGTNDCIIKDTCKCNPAEDFVTCYCTNNNVSHITKLSNTLPLPIPNGLVSTEGLNKIPTIRTTAISVDLMLTLNANISDIKQEIQDFQCLILPQHFLGCYNCVKGSSATILCKSDISQSIAQVNCGEQTLTLTCSLSGTSNNVRLFFNKAQVHETCRAQCGTHITIFELQGTLNYINGIQPLWNYIRLWNNDTVTDNSSINFDLALPDFSHFIHTCKQFLIYSVTILLLLTSALMVSYRLLCSQTSKTSRGSSHMVTIASIFPPLQLILFIIVVLKQLLSFTTRLLRLPLRILGSSRLFRP